MDKPVEDCVCDGGIADGLMPLVDGQLACDDGGCLPVPILEDFQQIASFLGVQDGQAPIVENEHLCAFDGFGEHQKVWGLCCHLHGLRLRVERSDSEARIPLHEFGAERAVKRTGPGLEHEVRATF